LKVLADRGRCQGYGTCVLAAPDVFDVDESGLVVLLVEDVPADKRAEIKQTVRDCPTGALAVEER